MASSKPASAERTAYTFPNPPAPRRCSTTYWPSMIVDPSGASTGHPELGRPDPQDGHRLSSSESITLEQPDQNVRLMRLSRPTRPHSWTVHGPSNGRCWVGFYVNSMGYVLARNLKHRPTT